jgi:LysW-gamma-L-lysine carboxypeptidase
VSDQPRPTDAEVIALLEALVRIPSYSGQEAEAAAYAVAAMRDLAYDQAVVDAAGNATGYLGDGERDVVLLGHIDTVAGVVPVRREGGCLYGRGAVDAKGPLATMLAAAARARPLRHLRVHVIGAVEEEAATSKGARHVVGRHRPVAAVIGEPSGWDRITVAYKGRLLVDYSLERPVGHSAGRETGAAEEAVAYWNAVAAYARAYNQNLERAYDTLDPSLRALNTASDGLVERATMRIGLRLPLALDPDALAQRLRQWAGDAQVRTHGAERAYRAEKRTPLASAFLGAIRDEGSRGTYVTKTGTSDMNVVGPVWGCPLVAYGPGDSALDHTPSEHIVLDEYLAAIRVLTRALRTLDDLAGAGRL